MNGPPVKGLSMRRTKNGVPVVRLHYSALPFATPEWIAKERARYTSMAWWDLEMEIKYDAMSGQRIYPEFDPAIHVVDPAEIPKRGCRYMSIDPHPRTPHAALWVLIDRFSDWWIYRELWPSVVCGEPRLLKDDEEDNSFTIREYAETYADLEGNLIEWRFPETDDEYGIYRRQSGGEYIIDRFMDQAGKGFIASGESQNEETYAKRYDRFGLQCRDPYKSHKSGEDAIRALLKPRRHDTRGLWPRLHISSACPELILEFTRHRYKKLTKGRSDERELKQQGVEARSHLLDDLRYLATSNIAHIPTLES